MIVGVTAVIIMHKDILRQGLYLSNSTSSSDTSERGHSRLTLLEPLFQYTEPELVDINKFGTHYFEGDPALFGV